MKLSALAAQIKNCGHCEVINNGGRIFVGTGSAFYCMDGYPRTQDAGELGAMLGIPQKKMKNIFYHEKCDLRGLSSLPVCRDTWFPVQRCAGLERPRRSSPFPAEASRSVP